MKFTAQASIVAFLLAMMSGNAMADCRSEGGIEARTWKGLLGCFRPLAGDCKSQGGVYVSTFRGNLACLKPLDGDCKSQGGAYVNAFNGVSYCFKSF
ncbi:MAG: hypothetical protein JOS17DRAFT_734707 [Linnemannia elongata]|nr:MAG: hypothetical protein JOS17DRAFT_734707 [Linnemannia elongata]